MMWYAVMMGMLQGMWDENMSRLWVYVPRHVLSDATEQEDPAEGMSSLRSKNKQGL